MCNLACDYCFYLEKHALFPGGRALRMSDDMLERYVREYIAAQPGPEVTFAWQGGEPTLMGLPFFRKAVDYQRRFAMGKRISNALQTNGTLLDEAWGAFLKAEDFLVGISIDGPREVHDRYRVRRDREPSFDQVMRGLEILQRHGVAYNTLTCVHAGNARRPLDVYRFLRGIGSRYMQFIPIVERRPQEAEQRLGMQRGGPPAADAARAEDVYSWSVRPDDFGYFMIKIFDRWVRNDVGNVFVQHIDSALGSWLGVGAGLCVFDETCGRALAMEHDGSVYACDHYVYPEFRLGRLGEDSLAKMADSRRMSAFGDAKRETLPQQCRACAVRFACNGGCPKHRFTSTASGETGLNYLCEAYDAFFRHIEPCMRVMAELYRSGRPPAEIMKRVRGGRI